MSLGSMQYKYERKTSITDVLNTVPGVFMQSRYGNHDVRISIRGFGSRSNSGIRGVRILLDGIPESEPDGQTRIEAIDFNAVGNIEIVKGNSSSLYTNAPGGVINFINNVYFSDSYFQNHNEFADYGLIRSGFKTGVRTPHYGMMITYTHHDFKGYRQHSSDYWHILNTIIETFPNDHSKLEILGYFVDGLIELPGSLTRAEYEEDPRQAAQRELDFDFKRISRKGRLGLRYNVFFGPTDNNELEITGYGTIKYFERAQRDYRVMNRFGIGGSVRYINRSEIFNRDNEFSTGADFFYQAGPIESYTNINGERSDILLLLTNETISNSGAYFLNNYELLNEKLYFLISGRYDDVLFDQKNQVLQAQNDMRRFGKFTPKAALNYKITPHVAVYTSYGLSFDSPAGNELDNYPTSSSPSKLLNPDLQPQKSKNFEVGLKGNIINPEMTFFHNIYFDLTLFNSIIDDEIVPFEVYSEFYFRNSARTERRGIELGADIDILRGLKMRFAYTWSDFIYDEYNALAIELDSLGDISTNQLDFSGNVVPSVPEHNINLSLQYEKKLTENVTGFIKGNYAYISGMYVDDENSDKVNGYNLLNSTIGMDFRVSELSIILSMGLNNLLDTRYIGFININSAGKRFYEGGIPRNGFGSIVFRYNF
jgi:iron complex outermembrane recepter protein